MYELSILSLISLCLVSFIGVPHGSFDGAVAALLGYQSKKKFLTFIFWYTIISIAVIFFWIQFSLIALFLFIIMSIIHFGLCDWSFLRINQFKWIVTLTHGINIVFGIIFFHTPESFQIFTYLFIFSNCSELTIAPAKELGSKGSDGFIVSLILETLSRKSFSISF